MSKEIERKFLVPDHSNFLMLRHYGRTEIMQGYVASSGPDGGLLVRVRRAGDQAFLTLKGPRIGITCGEWEYPIPVADAIEMLSAHSVTGVIEKTRYRIPSGAHFFELDVFKGGLAGLVIAEVELSDEAEQVELPAWLGREVSHDLAYTNINLAKTLAMQGALPEFH